MIHFLRLIFQTCFPFHLLAKKGKLPENHPSKIKPAHLFTDCVLMRKHKWGWSGGRWWGKGFTAVRIYTFFNTEEVKPCHASNHIEMWQDGRSEREWDEQGGEYLDEGAKVIIHFLIRIICDKAKQTAAKNYLQLSNLYFLWRYHCTLSSPLSAPFLRFINSADVTLDVREKRGIRVQHAARRNHFIIRHVWEFSVCVDVIENYGKLADSN